MREVVLFLALVCLAVGSATPLDDYVNKPDPTYSYKILSKTRGATHTLYTLNMTSQSWKSSMTSQSVWWHYLSITIPDKITRNSAFMLIDGGSNHASPPPGTDNFVELTTIVAVSTNSIGACLKQIPNEPITFKDDPTQKSRDEDAIIAWTWKTFVDNNGSDPEILLRMPMTKASVRGLDTIADLAMKEAGIKVNKFLVAGASKRGWTTWTTAAVDKRVVGLAPMVEDLLNIVKNVHHYYRSLGGWTFAFDDYYNLNFTMNLDNPATQLMANIIDPIAYKDRYKDKPILIISTGGDEFFMIDDSRFYYDELVGPTYLRMVPNAEHSLAGHETSVMFAIRAFYLSVVDPDLRWTCSETTLLVFPRGGSILMFTAGSTITKNGLEAGMDVYRWAYNTPDRDSPSNNPCVSRNYTRWTAIISAHIRKREFHKKKHLANRKQKVSHRDQRDPTFIDTIHTNKDFRLLRGTPGDPSKPEVHPVFWLQKDAVSKGNNTWIAECDNPDVGWTAFFIQVTFPGVDGSVLEFTTQTLVTPDTYPFPDCHGTSCLGTLV